MPKHGVQAKLFHNFADFSRSKYTKTRDSSRTILLVQGSLPLQVLLTVPACPKFEMSGAEALLVLGVIANIIQVIEFSAKAIE